MSGEVIIRVWLRGGSARERLDRVVAAVAQWPAIDGDWEPVRINAVGIIVSGVPVRLRGGPVRLGIEAWDAEKETAENETAENETAGHPRRPDRDLDGDAGLWFSETRPVLNDPDALVDLLLLLIERLDPDRLAVHDDGGFHHPLNARAVYHRSIEGFAEDLAVLRRLWERGSPPWRLPALSDPATPLDSDALHSARSPRRRADLWARLACLPETAPAARVERALAVRRDRVLSGPGVLLLSSPRVLDEFVDDFYDEFVDDFYDELPVAEPSAEQ